jgi:TPR repeat protein
VLFADRLLKGIDVDQNLAQASRYFRLAGETGDAAAKVALAERLAEGRGVPQSFEEAHKFFRLAADIGDSRMKLYFASRLAEGRSVKQNSEEALLYFRYAADTGDYRTKVEFAERLRAGRGVPQNAEEAKWYFELSSLSESPSTKWSRAERFVSGSDGVQDLSEAARLFKSAADDPGSGGYRFRYAVRLVYGYGVAQDVKAGVEYCRAAADLGDADASLLYAGLCGAGKWVPHNREDEIKYAAKWAMKQYSENYPSGKYISSDEWKSLALRADHDPSAKLREQTIIAVYRHKLIEKDWFQTI